MRSVIDLASQDGIAAIVKQQFEVGEQIARHGLMPIIEPEVSIKSPDKAAPRRSCSTNCTKGLDALPAGRKVMFKLTIPDVPDFYAPLIERPAGAARRRAVGRLYARRSLQEARRESRHDRQLLARADRGLKESMSDAEFDKALAESIDEIYQASRTKVPA